MLKEDSTKGSAKILPVNYKGDVLTQVWLDARKLAVLSEWLDSNGYSTRHLSEVIKFTVDEIVEQLVEAGLVSKIEFTSDARELLTMKYRTDLNPSRRGMRNVVHNLHLDELRRGNVYKGEKEQRIYGTGFEDVEAKTRKGVEIYNQMEAEEEFKDQQRNAEESKKRISAVYEPSVKTSSGETIMRRKDELVQHKVIKQEPEIKLQSKKIQIVDDNVDDTAPATDNVFDLAESQRRISEADDALRDMP